MPPQFEDVSREIADELGWSYEAYVSRGAFKETYKLQDTVGLDWALKIFDPGKCNNIRQEREISSMLSCNCPRVVRIHRTGDHVSSTGQKYTYLIEEFITGGTLTSLLNNGPLPPDQVRSFAMAMCEALEHLHEKRLVHRDVKPDNIMLRNDILNPVLVDFGLVRDLSQSSVTATWLPAGPGTPLYSSPEQLLNEKNMIDWRCDQFALGLVLGEAATGQHPFLEDGLHFPDAVSRIASKEACTDQFKVKSIELELEFISKMIEPWPVRRFSSPAQLRSAI